MNENSNLANVVIKEMGTGKEIYTVPVLIRLLKDAARRKGQTIDQLAQKLGVTVGYIHQLSSGVKQVKNISRCFVQSASQVLQLPPIIVMMLAGAIKPSDWVSPSQLGLVHEGVRVQDMTDDKRWAVRLPFSPNSIAPELVSVQLCLYESFTGCLGGVDGGTPRLLSHLYRMLLRVGLDQLDDQDLELAGALVG
ncbi:helix-turn-helix domain-containing protein [Paucibacter sp. DJ4R-1]|nr:helix-turn-helix domain-containing protein [Paucibacter sp. DJ4R-1]